MALMTVIAAYDVTSDDRRARLAALLQSVGDRVQRSVFVLSLEPEDLDELRTRALRIIDPGDDSLYLFRQCVGCWGQVQCLGQADPPTRTLYWAVL